MSRRGAAPPDREPWWKRAVVYQIYPRSFADGNGNGLGDLEGIRRELDHLQWLGVDAVWISPFYRSPMKDAGYDVADYEDVDPRFGSLADFDRLLAEAHDRGLRVLVDYVPNHTSDRHPWFRDSRSARTSRKRDWYIWRDEPNNWRAALNAGSAWTYDEATDQYYLHLFLPEQPDLNWRNEEVIDAMHGVLGFWLDRGVDGFRIDVAHCVGKDPDFADDARAAAGEPLASYNDQPYSHEVLRGIRKVIDSYPGDRVIVGEVNIRSTEKVVQYYGAGDELQLAFNFRPLDAPWDAAVLRADFEQTEKMTAEASAWPTWVLSNHDNSRQRSRYGGSMRRARAAAVLLLTARGTPFVFQGEELGLEDVVVTAETRVDPGGRDGPRGPLPWTPRPPHGWLDDHTWLPFPPDSDTLDVQTQRADPGSILHLYRRLIAARRDSPALQLGDFRWHQSRGHVMAWRRRLDDDERFVAVNFAEHEVDMDLPGCWRVEVASQGSAEGDRYTGSLAAEQAVLLRPDASD